MSEDTKVFDAEYVSSLRKEAANYRTQVRDLESRLGQIDQLEAQIKATRVENELIRRGIQAAPEWVPLSEDQTPTEAVDSFLTKYPHLAPQSTEDAGPKPRKAPDPLLGPSDNDRVQVTTGKLNGRDIEEIQEDPKARANLRDLYRDLLRQSSHQGDQ